MTKTTHKPDTTTVVPEEQDNKSIKIGSLKLSKTVVAIIATVAVILVAILGFKYLYMNPKEEKAQSMLTENNTKLFSSEGKQRLAQMREVVFSAQRAYDAEKVKGDSANLALKDTLDKRMTEYAAAKSEFYNKALKGDGKIPGLLKIAEESFTAAANLAKGQAGVCYYELGNYKEAIKYLEDYTPQGDKTVSPLFLAALANSYAADGQVDKAVETFKNAAHEADNSVSSPKYLLEAGLLLQSQKKNDEALKLYQEIKSEYPNSELVLPKQIPGGGYAASIDKYMEAASK